MEHHNRSPAILVVEGDPSARWTYQRLLEEERYDVTTTDTGHEALSICRSRWIDLAIVDAGLPGRESHDLQTALQVEFPLLRLLLITGGPSRQTICPPPARAGLIHTLPKSLSPARLLEIVRTLLGPERRPSP